MRLYLCGGLSVTFDGPGMLCTSQRCLRNQTLVNNVCEIVPHSMFWTSNGLNYRSQFRIFLLSRQANQSAYSNSGTQDEAFGVVSLVRLLLQRRLALCLLLVENRSSAKYFQIIIETISFCRLNYQSFFRPKVSYPLSFDLRYFNFRVFSLRHFFPNSVCTRSFSREIFETLAKLVFIVTNPGLINRHLNLFSATYF